MKHFINFTLLLLLPAFFNSNFQSQANLPQTNLIEPKKNATFVETPTKFSWNKVQNAEFYEIQISTDVTFMNFNSESDIGRDNFSDTTYNVPPVLLLDTMYFWRVAAKNSETPANDSVNNYWENSEIRMFKTGVKSSIFENKKFDFPVSIFPMPIQNQANIRFNANENSIFPAEIKIFIFDSGGKLVGKLKDLSTKNSVNSQFIDFKIDVSQFQSGNYILFFMDENSKIISAENIIILR